MIEFTMYALDYLRRAARQVSEAQRQCGCPRHALAVVYREHDIIGAVVDGASALNHVPLIRSPSPQPAQGCVAVVRWDPGMPVPESMHDWRAFCERAIAHAAPARGSQAIHEVDLRAEQLRAPEPSVPAPEDLVPCALSSWQRVELAELLSGYAVPVATRSKDAVSLAHLMARLRWTGARIRLNDDHYIYAGPTLTLPGSWEWPEQRVWAPYPLGYAPSHEPTFAYRVSVDVPAWSDAIFVVAPAGKKVDELKFRWRAESVRVLAVVTDGHATVEDAECIPVIRVRRALWPWVAQQLALQRWELEVLAEELAR